jgi:hypothetical protein
MIAGIEPVTLYVTGNEGVVYAVPVGGLGASVATVL